MEFTNALWRRRRSARDQVRVIPPDRRDPRRCQPPRLVLRGATKGAYKVPRDARGHHRDVFGQTLGAPATVSFETGEARTIPWRAGRASRHSRPCRRAECLCLHGERAGGEGDTARGDAQRLAEISGLDADQEDEDAHPPGRAVRTRPQSVALKPDELVETRIPLGPALSAGLGHVVLLVEQVEPPEERWERRRVALWIQSTQIGLDAFVDRETSQRPRH